MAPAVMQAQQKKAFRGRARKRMEWWDTIDYAAGATTRSNLPAVGFLSRIFLHFSATVTLGGGGGVLAADGPWGIIREIELKTNNGSSSIYRVSGFGTAIVNQQFMRSGYNPTMPSVFQASTAAGAQQWEFTLEVPVALNDQLQMEMGLLNLQAPQVTCTLATTWATNTSEFCSNVTSVTNAECKLVYSYYEVPNPKTVLFPPLIVHRILEEQAPLTRTGDFIYTFPNGGELLQLMHIIQINHLNLTAGQGFNGTQSNLVDRFRLVGNKSDTVFDIPGRTAGYLNSYQSTVWGGVYMWNFLDAGVTEIGEGDFRDTINSEAISTLESVLTINSAAPIEATSNVRSVRRILQGLRRAA